MAPFTLKASATSGLSVTFSSDTPAICTVNNHMVTPVTTGTCVIIAGQNGDVTYNPAPPVTLTFQIIVQNGPAQQTVFLPLVAK